MQNFSGGRKWVTRLYLETLKTLCVTSNAYRDRASDRNEGGAGCEHSGMAGLVHDRERMPSRKVSCYGAADNGTLKALGCVFASTSHFKRILKLKVLIKIFQVLNIGDLKRKLQQKPTVWAK